MTTEQFRVHLKYKKIVRVLFVIETVLLIAAGISWIY